VLTLRNHKRIKGGLREDQRSVVSRGHEQKTEVRTCKDTVAKCLRYARPVSANITVQRQDFPIKSHQVPFCVRAWVVGDSSALSLEGGA